MDPQVKRKAQFSGAYFLLAAAALLLVQSFVVERALGPRQVPYNEFLKALREGLLAEVQVRQADILAVKKSAGEARSERLVTSRLPGLDETALLSELQERQVQFSGRIDRTSWLESFLLGWVLPLGILGAVYFWLMSRMGRGAGPLTFGKSKARIYDQAQHGRVTFADVAGVEEAKGELAEVVDFLKNPSRYQAIGARIPKGVLLVGPPGTGKTLLARAVAGEASVPFFSLSGSEFIEMFVGLGAARMRDLFEQAKQRAPCIVFIDELDAIGKARGGMLAVASHDEREQTLNQLLVEMDGFDSTRGVILMAATNRPEVLDPALRRAGRFDRQVVVDRPDVRGRQAILEVHARRVRLDGDADLRVVAQRTPGMTGADLANVVNEAALAAARRGSETVARRDFEQAVDRLQLGLEKRGGLLSPEEKRRVAWHEAGHTLAALSVEHADPVHRVTIIPRSIGALGATLQLPDQERTLLTRDQLLDRVCVLMGGRAAEELALGDTSTGAHNDLERASELARQMACRFGMSRELGPVSYGRPGGPRFLDVGGGEERNYSEKTAQAIDAEVRRLLTDEYARALTLLTRRRDALERIATRLLEVETLERTELERLAGGQAQDPAGERRPAA